MGVFGDRDAACSRQSQSELAVGRLEPLLAPRAAPRVCGHGALLRLRRQAGGGVA